MISILNVIIAITAVLLILVILLQSQGSGLGAAYGGSSNSYRSRRGAERGLFIFTILLAGVMIVSLLARLILA